MKKRKGKQQNKRFKNLQKRIQEQRQKIRSQQNIKKQFRKLQRKIQQQRKHIKYQQRKIGHLYEIISTQDKQIQNWISTTINNTNHIHSIRPEISQYPEVVHKTSYKYKYHYGYKK